MYLNCSLTLFCRRKLVRKRDQHAKHLCFGVSHFLRMGICQSWRLRGSCPFGIRYLTGARLSSTNAPLRRTRVWLLLPRSFFGLLDNVKKRHLLQVPVEEQKECQSYLGFGSQRRHVDERRWSPGVGLRRTSFGSSGPWHPMPGHRIAAVETSPQLSTKWARLFVEGYLFLG